MAQYGVVPNPWLLLLVAWGETRPRNVSLIKLISTLSPDFELNSLAARM